MKNKKAGYNAPLIPLKLQLFAEDSGGDGAAGNGSDALQNEETLSFDDFLKGEGNQAEFDRRMQEAINIAVTNAQKKWQAVADDKLSEAEKLAKMTKEEKAHYLQEKKEKELTDREAAITRRELMAEAKNTLAEKKLPVELADILNYADADSCKKSISMIEKAFQKAVEGAVQERLKGDAPATRASGVLENNKLAQQIEAIMLGQH